MPRLVLRSLACCGALLASTVCAADLPPKEAAPYTGVYEMRMRQREAADRDWKYITEDTVTIAVLNKQVRVDGKKSGNTYITDTVSRFTTSFGGKVPPGTAIRSQSPFTAIGWELGWATVAKATERDPEVLGEATIAGQPCTRLKYVSDQFGEPEFCVAKNGIVLKFSNASSDSDVSYQAVSIDTKAPDASRFVTPADLKVEDNAGPRKLKAPF